MPMHTMSESQLVARLQVFDQRVNTCEEERMLHHYVGLYQSVVDELIKRNAEYEAILRPKKPRKSRKKSSNPTIL